MRFAVICLRKNGICTVVASGEYSELSNTLDLLNSTTLDSELTLIEMDESEYNEIKDDATKINEKLSQYFFDTFESEY